jgi:hypothetical protein
MFKTQNFVWIVMLGVLAPRQAGGAILMDFAADRGVVSSGDGHVTLWQDQSGRFFNAAAQATGPLVATTVVNGITRPVLRFDGGNVLIAAPHVPATGTVFAVYANSTPSEVDCRLLGWEDSAIGRHGFAIQPTYTQYGPCVNVVARKSGAVGDVLLPPRATTMETIALSWGASGVTMERRLTDGTLVTGYNSNIDSISDRGYALHIGGPGDEDYGWHQRFQGDLAVLRIFDTQLDLGARSSILNGLYQQWVAVPEPGAVALLVLGAAGLARGRRRRHGAGPAAGDQPPLCPRGPL